MILKGYQEETLAALRRFLEEARIAGPKAAYEAMVAEPERAARLGGYAGAYEPLEELPGVPYVCLRLPTGGGKTLLGAHAVSVARDAWIEREHPLVLWLAPTNVIRRQTADALKDVRHPCRRALDEAFGGRVRVFDIADFAHLRPHDAREKCCVVVATIQTLRVRSTEGRKVYAHHEDMEAHFSGLAAFPPGLERMEDGGVKYSFANFLHLSRPLMIVDEAHNAVTELTGEMRRRVRPCAIVEFTATPRPKSNILHSASARELRDAEMIKLPVVLSEHADWRAAVNGALASRAALAEKARAEPDYVRPIVLLQAQKRNQAVPVEALRRHLIEEESVPEERVAVATGAQRELDGVDLFDPKCPVECVITVEALKEGWDCSFAYVFCSVSRIQSATDAEQLLGRVLRMPYARRREAPELNKAHAHLSEPSFGEAARALVDRMTAMGFEEREALDSIETRDGLPFGEGLFAPKKPRFTYRAPATEEVRAALAQAGVAARETEAGEVEIEVPGWVDERVEEKIARALPEAGRADFARAARAYREEAKALLSPAERGERIVAPRLMARIQGELAFADADEFAADHEWSLLDHPARLEEGEFTVRETANRFEIDLDGKRLAWSSLGESERLPLDVPVEGWTPEALVGWLDGETRGIDITQGELLRWLSDLVGRLTGERGIPVAALTRCKFILARRIRAKLDAIRRKERGKAYQRALFGPGAGPEVSFRAADAFVFEEGMYLDRPRYRGGWRPNKCFLPRDQMPAFDGAEGGEETRCARALDALPGVRHWTRNVSRHPRSLWLPTATGRFYPDFVAALEDGRLLVVEYKGDQLATADDAREKRTIGRLWEKKGGGLFLMVEKEKDGKDMRAQLLEKIGRA